MIYHDPPPKDLLIRYVLADASSEEIDQIEDAYFSDPVVLQSIIATRDEMIDDFIAGTLDPGLKIAFERRLRASPAMSSKVQFARTFRRAIHIKTQGGPELQAERSRGETAVPLTQKSMRRLSFGAHRPGTWASRGVWAAAAAGVLVALTATWQATRSPTPSGAGIEIALNSPAERSPAPTPTSKPPTSGVESSMSPLLPPDRPKPQESPKSFGTIATFLLSASLSRDADDLPTLKIPTAAQTLRLQLELEEPSAGPYQATLESQTGKIIFRKKNLSIRRSGDASLVIVDVPARLLTDEAYIFYLIAQTEDSPSPTKYYFKKVREQ